MIDRLVDRWRAEYRTVLESATRDQGNWTSVRSIYRDALDRLLTDYPTIDLSTGQREELTDAWQRLVPWPDAMPGLSRLEQSFTLATLSNADVCTVVNISKRGALPWDAIFTAQMAGVFKPAAEVYHMAARFLGLTPPKIMMVAYHKHDIRAESALGFRTAFVARALELGAGPGLLRRRVRTCRRPTRPLSRGVPTRPRMVVPFVMPSEGFGSPSLVTAVAVSLTP